jgi:uncharacterized protein YndB with AHSA1/START domain
VRLDGSVERAQDGGWVVAFDRVLDKPPEKVWSVLTEPKRLANWLGDVDVDLRIGGAFVIRFRQMSVTMTGQITALEPGRMIEYSWLENNQRIPASKVRWEIVPTSAGCRLRLTHRFPAGCALKDLTPFMGGWHAFFDAIPVATEDTFVPYADEKELEAGYRRRCLEEEMLDERALFLKRAGVKLERLLPGPITRVWDHLTRPELLPGWFGGKSSIEARVGGAVSLMDGHVRGTVTRWAPPHQLSYTWNVFAPGDGPDAVSAYPESYLTLTLEVRGEQVLLTLDHLPVLERFEKQNAMGWHTFLDILSDTLAQRAVGERKDYMARNAARYGVDLSNLQR